MLFLQLKQAEVAMADGRLDEAYQLIAPSQPLRSHRRGQALITQLIDLLVQRAESHRQAGRTVQALADCEKAQILGGNLEKVVAIRSAVEDDVRSTLADQRRRAQSGMLAAAVGLVDSAMHRQDLDGAVAELVRARGQGCDDSRMRGIDAELRATLRSQIQQALSNGRLDLIGTLMDRLSRLDPDGLQTRQFARAMEQARTAWDCLRRADVAAAQEALHRLSALLPGLAWINVALDQLGAAEQSLRALRAGPLGLMAMADTTPPPNLDPLPARPRPREMNLAEEGLPWRFIIQVDGAGSYLVLRRSIVTLGPISSSRQPDVGLIAEAGAGIVTIERMEDDYFLRTAGAAAKLLSSGDRIAISQRCRLGFGLPNPASTSAVLDLLGGRFPRADLRRVILLDRDLVIGPGNSAHIRADQLTQPVVLHVREGRLWHKATPIELASPLSVAGVGIVATVA